jgi:putative hemolysin
VQYVAKNIPKASEKFTWRNLTFEIIDMDGARVDKVLVNIDE